MSACIPVCFRIFTYAVGCPETCSGALFDLVEGTGNPRLALDHLTLKSHKS